MNELGPSASSKPSDADGAALAALLQRVGEQDRAAFAALYRATSAKLLGVVIRMLKDRQAAEDVVQEVYVTVWRKAAEYEPARASAGTWLLVIARNRAIDRLRSADVRRAEPLEQAALVADGAPLPDALAQQSGDLIRVQAAMKDLDPRHAELIHATYVAGLSYEDAARRAGVPVGTAKTWVHRGLMKLKQRLGG